MSFPAHVTAIMMPHIRIVSDVFWGNNKDSSGRVQSAGTVFIIASLSEQCSIVFS